MDKTTLDELVKTIKETRKGKQISPRNLFEAFGYYRRTINNCYWVDKYLADNQLEMDPNYNDVWFDYPCELRIKPKKASRSIKKDAVRRIKEIEQAHNAPMIITENQSISEAITIMQIHNYSQLPIVNAERKLCGYISLDTIVSAIAKGVSSDNLIDYASKEPPTLSLEGLFLDAIVTTRKYGFVIIVEEERPVGIVTCDDLAAQYYSWAKSFYLIEEIENHIRNLIADNCTQEEIEKVCHGNGSKPVSVDDMTFGAYIQIFKNEDIWKKFKFKYVNQAEFIKSINDVREIRNAVMHFKTMEVSDERQEILEQAARYLGIISPSK